MSASFPPFNLYRLLNTVFQPKKGEKLCVLIDLENPQDAAQCAFLNHDGLTVQKKAYEIFYQGLLNGVMDQLDLGVCDFFAYQITGGSNLELPDYVHSPQGSSYPIERAVYSAYDIILCLSVYSAMAPLTAASKKFGFRGATLHGLNDIILETGLAVDYNTVSRDTEKLRKGMTYADSIEIDFHIGNDAHFLALDLSRQNAQKSHGICHSAPDIVNLPAGEVYFVPTNAKGSFPLKFEDGSIGIMHVEQGRAYDVHYVKGNRNTIVLCQKKLNEDPATGILGELGFGTQILPFSGSDIQDEKIFGSFHLALGRNDHLEGSVTKDQFKCAKNATHDDILFSAEKTPEIAVKQVRMNRYGRTEVLIENYKPAPYLWSLLNT